MTLAAILDAGRRDFLDAARDISQAHASAKATPGGWSVLECIEHVVTVEERHLAWIEAGSVIEHHRNADKEMRLFTTIRNRLTKVEAPDVVRPAGRYRTLAAALAAFEAVRNRSIHMVTEKGDALYSIGARHPYFGKVNGAELVHLMDGHARRHADQIREICEALRTRPPERSKAANGRKSAGFKRDAPDLPAHLEQVIDSDRLFRERESITLQDARMQGSEHPDLKIDGFRIEGSVLDRVQFAGGHFASIVWKDVRLVGCDLSNVRAHRMVLVRVEMVDCRLTGLTTSAVDWQDVLIQNGDVRYAQMQGGTFRNCEFSECRWQEADLQGSDLTGTVFRLCKLTRADFQNATLNNTDFRTSDVEELLVGMKDLRGAIVDPAQAMVFAKVLGLRIM